MKGPSQQVGRIKSHTHSPTSMATADGGCSMLQLQQESVSRQVIASRAPHGFSSTATADYGWGMLLFRKGPSQQADRPPPSLPTFSKQYETATADHGMLLLRQGTRQQAAHSEIL